MASNGLGPDVRLRPIQGARFVYIVGIGISLPALRLAALLDLSLFCGSFDDAVARLQTTVGVVPNLLFLILALM